MGFLGSGGSSACTNFGAAMPADPLATILPSNEPPHPGTQRFPLDVPTRNLGEVGVRKSVFF